MDMVTQLFLTFLIILLSSVIQGITSFGFSLVALPLLGMFLPLKIVVPMLVLYSLVLNIIILYHIRHHINIKQIAILVIFGIIGTPVGAHLLQIMDENTLKVIIGVLVTITAMINLYGFKIKVKNQRLSYIPVGFMSGILNGSVSLGGPPLVLFLTNQGVEKQRFRANLTSYFLILNIFTIPTYFLGGLITGEVVNYTLYVLPALIIGAFLGVKLGNKVDEHIFRRFTLGLIIATGLLSIITGIK